MKREEMLPEYEFVLNQYGLEEIDKNYIYQLVYKKGEYICLEGQPLENLLFLVNGRVKVCHTTENGKTLLYCFYTGQGMLGEVELMKGCMDATTSVQAITPVICIAVPLHYFSKWLKSNISFLNCVGKALAKKLDRSGRNSAVTILHPLETRICNYVLMMEENGLFYEKLTVLAELLGTSYRHLLRTLNHLCYEGVLAKEKNGYRIINAEMLQNKSEDYYLNG